jgi:hypothetical protein
VTQDPLRPDITWVQSGCRLLAEYIEQSEFNPECIVGIAFGGILPASFLSVFLRKPLCVFRVVHYNGRTRLPEPVIETGLESFPDVATLVVDDLVDSGETMKVVQDYLGSHGVTNVRFATLHRKPSSAFIPDWYVRDIIGWVHYPWEDE